MWISQKISKPATLTSQVFRSKLQTKLQENTNKRLVLFNAPAGYGKTTSVVQWLENVDEIAWFTIDITDNDIFRFANYLIQSINRVTGNSCSRSGEMAKSRQFANLTTFFSQTLDELSTFNKQLYIVLDDYHQIESQEIHDAVQFLIKYLPANITLIITSRTQPPLGIAYLLVKNQVLEITSTDLAFDSEESHSLLAPFFHENQDENKQLEELIRQVDGWPSALQLISLSLSQHKTVQIHDKLSTINFHYIWDYLAEEVFEQLEEDTKLFLLQCSIFDNFNIIMMKKITRNIDVGKEVETISHLGLFFTTQDEQEVWYRFHHLFSDFLKQRRKVTLASEETKLQAKAAQIWLEQNQPILALQHAILGEAPELCINILEQSGWDIFHHGELLILDDALSYIDEDALYSVPGLVLLKAWLSQSQHRGYQVESILNNAEKRFKKENTPLDIEIAGGFNAIRAQIAINQEKPEQALELSQKALSQLPQSAHRNRIVVTSIVGEVHHVLGKLDKASQIMQETELLARKFQLYHQALWAMLQQAEILRARGKLDEAQKRLEQIETFVLDKQLQQIPLYEFLLRLKSEIAWLRGHYDDAAQYAKKGHDVLSHYNESLSLQCYGMLGLIAFSRQDKEQAQWYISRCNTLLMQDTYHIDWVSKIDFLRLLHWHQSGDMNAIRQFISRAVPPETACNHFQQQQIANLAYAHLSLGETDKAQEYATFAYQETERVGLVLDKNKILMMLAMIALQRDNFQQTQAFLKEAILLSLKTKMNLYNLFYPEILGELRKLMRTDWKLPYISNEEEKEAKNFIHQIVSQSSSDQNMESPFSKKDNIRKILSHPLAPEVLLLEPLTQREWQVLGMIQMGYRNEEIADNMQVAYSTIKTHIRNLYQKIQIKSRKQAIEFANHLLDFLN